MSHITVIGSLNMDLVVSTPRVPVMGETILGNGFMTAPGGKGANQAVAIARLGGNVSMVGCLGNDIFGKDLLRNLKDNHVKCENIKMLEDTATGVAMIVLHQGNNFIIVDPGANYRLSPGHIEEVEALIKESSMIVVQLEIPQETVEKAITLAKKHHVKVLLNPAPARNLDAGIYSRVDILTPNESECEAITGLSVRSVEDAKKAVEYLIKKGIPQVIVTLGSKGVVYNNGSALIHKPVRKVQAVDTTAAGDSFTGAMAVALSQGWEIDEAIDFANTVGTLTVMKKGAQTSLPTLAEVENFRKT